MREKNTKTDEMGGACGMHLEDDIWMHTEFLWKNPKKRGKLEDIGIEGKTQFKLILKKRVGFMQLRVGTGGGLLWIG